MEPELEFILRDIIDDLKSLKANNIDMQNSSVNIIDRISAFEKLLKEQKPHPTRRADKKLSACLRDIILRQDTAITRACKYGMRFFCYKGKMFCYLWVHKKYKQPYIGIVEGKSFDELFLIQETIKTIILLTSVACFISCSDKSSQLSSKQISEVRDSALKMTQFIASSVSQQGPIAWLHYFEDTSAFFMASAGQLVFPNNDSAKHFIRNT